MAADAHILESLRNFQIDRRPIDADAFCSSDKCALNYFCNRDICGTTGVLFVANILAHLFANRVGVGTIDKCGGGSCIRYDFSATNATEHLCNRINVTQMGFGVLRVNSSDSNRNLVMIIFAFYN